MESQGIYFQWSNCITCQCHYYGNGKGANTFSSSPFSSSSFLCRSYNGTTKATIVYPNYNTLQCRQENAKRVTLLTWKVAKHYVCKWFTLPSHAFPTALEAMPHNNDFVTMRGLDAIFAMLEIVDDTVVVWHSLYTSIISGQHQTQIHTRSLYLFGEIPH